MNRSHSSGSSQKIWLSLTIRIRPLLFHLPALIFALLVVNLIDVLHQTSFVTAGSLI